MFILIKIINEILEDSRIIRFINAIIKFNLNIVK